MLENTSETDSMASANKASECPSTPAIPFPTAITAFVIALNKAVRNASLFLDSISAKERKNTSTFVDK